MGNDVTSSAAGDGFRRAHEAFQARSRDAVLEAARRILAKEGVSALTVRRLAQALGCSTKVIYTRFGGKDGLVHALYVEAFARLAEALAAVPLAYDPLVRLKGGIDAYRQVALADPIGYQIMFGGAIGEFTPPLASRRQAGETFGAMRRGVQNCMEAGLLAKGDANRTAKLIWATMHGAVSLELLGLLSEADPARFYADAVGATLRALGAPE
jgi:AcrR family transcriptional regulator